eukprot:scaffold112060_cov32-Attheya_sp.AAC.2
MEATKLLLPTGENDSHEFVSITRTHVIVAAIIVTDTEERTRTAAVFLKDAMAFGVWINLSAGVNSMEAS